jgi:5-methylcytosine-specific restriction endonuclease McrA
MKYTDEKIIEAVQQSKSYKEVAVKLGAYSKSGLSEHLRNKIKKLGLDVSHFTSNRKPPTNKLDYSEVFVFSEFRKSGNLLRKNLIEYGIEYKCNYCDNDGYWRDKVIPLEVDHIDGNKLNNTIDNLQFLCPNCHTCKTHSNAKHPKEHKNHCINYEKRRNSKTTLSGDCRNLKWIDKDILEKMVFEKPMEHIGKELNTSGKTIAYWCKIYGIKRPSRGYWQKVKFGSIPN